MLEVHKQVKARSDLKKIWKYSYKQHGEAQADKYYNQLIASIETIQNNPKIGIACDNIRKGYRCYHVKEHYFFYRVTANKIHIIRVLHEKMQVADPL